MYVQKFFWGSERTMPGTVQGTGFGGFRVRVPPAPPRHFVAFGFLAAAPASLALCRIPPTPPSVVWCWIFALGGESLGFH